MSDDKNTIYKPGMQVENKSSNSSDDGSLGCFARERNSSSAVLLSCAHVLFANLTGNNDVNLNIYCPPSSSTCCRNRHIATTLKNWVAGFGPKVAILKTGDPDPWNGYETDCAIARLQSGVLFSNEIPGIGMVSGTPSPGDLGVVAGPDFGTPPTPEQLVRFYSPITKRVYFGTILKPDKPGTYVGGGALNPLLWPEAAGGEDSDKVDEARPNVGQLVVMPRPAPGESLAPYLAKERKLLFGQFGDSGSVVVNKDNKIIGLLCRAGAKPNGDESFDEWKAVSGVGILNPIHKVLDRMNIDIPANFSMTTPSAGATYFVMPGIESDPDQIALERGQQRVAGKLRQSRFGRLLLGKLDQHRKEARQIVIRNRHALTVWHRHQGPAFVRHCMHNLRDPAHMVPTAINGVDRARLIGVMADLFVHYGSPKLRRDIEKYRALALQYGPGITSIDQVGPIIEEVRRQRLGR